MKGLLEEHFANANDFRSEVIPGAISKGMKVKPCYLIMQYICVCVCVLCRLFNS